LAKHNSRLADQAAIHIGHDRRGLLMPGEDEADLVAMVMDGIEQGACPTAGDAKDVIDPRLNKHFAHLLAGLHGDLLCAQVLPPFGKGGQGGFEGEAAG